MLYSDSLLSQYRDNKTAYKKLEKISKKVVDKYRQGMIK